MILKKEGIINEIIYNNTVYNNGENRYYLTINDLDYLITNIIETNKTTQYIRFTPFYINYKLNRQIEFDEYMFYLECRAHFSEDELKNHLSECSGKNYVELSEDERIRAYTLYPLCKNNDIIKFKELLISFKVYLNELIPFLFNKVREETNLSLDDMAFGFFCFEVHSN